MRIARLLAILLLPVALCLLPAPLRAAVGDEAAPCTSVSASATLDTVTSGTVVRNILNVFFEDNIEIQIFDGTNTVPFIQYAGPGFKQFTGAPLPATSASRVRFKNLNGSTAKIICYQWVEVKQ